MMEDNGMAKEALFQISVKMIIQNQENKMLLMEKTLANESYWDLPGGRINKGEDLVAAISREIFEETGIVDFYQIIPMGLVLSKKTLLLNDGLSVNLMFALYRSKVLHDAVVLSSEHQSFEWVTKQQAAQRLEYSFGKDFCNQLLEI